MGRDKPCQGLVFYQGCASYKMFHSVCMHVCIHIHKKLKLITAQRRCTLRIYQVFLVLDSGTHMWLDDQCGSASNCDLKKLSSITAAQHFMSDVSALLMHCLPAHIHSDARCLQLCDDECGDPSPRRLGVHGCFLPKVYRLLGCMTTWPAGSFRSLLHSYRLPELDVCIVCLSFWAVYLCGA